MRLTFGLIVLSAVLIACAHPTAPSSPASSAATATATANSALRSPHTLPPVDAMSRLTILFDALEKPNTLGKDPTALWTWTLATTPALPNTWPPTSDTVWTRYAYAHAREFQLADAVRVAKPWATVTLRSAGKDAALTQLANALEPISVQGIAPLTREQMAALQHNDVAQEHALSLTTLPDLSLPDGQNLKAFYQLWLRTNGTIARHVRPAHETFFRWLEE